MSRDIYIMDSEGRNIRNLTRTAGVSEGMPAWSPDGSQIVFGVQKMAESTNIVVRLILPEGDDTIRPSNFWCAHLGGMTLVVEQNVASDPIDVGLFGAKGVVFKAQGVAYLIQQFRGAGEQGVKR